MEFSSWAHAEFPLTLQISDWGINLVDAAGRLVLGRECVVSKAPTEKFSGEPLLATRGRAA